jgi:hypothetical protein
MPDKQVIFISATSDLRSARELVGKVLYSMGYEPVWQEIANTNGGEMLEVLRRRIAPASLVVQLVGRRYGAEPRDDVGEFGRMSYTQLEAFEAHRMGKKVIYLFLDDRFPTDSAEPEPVELISLQEAYRKQIADANHLRYEGIADFRDLEVWLLRIPETFKNLVDESPATQAGRPGELWCTKASRMVLELAWDLARQSGRAGVTSSCLLFAFAESANTEGTKLLAPMAQLIHRALDSRGEYGSGFRTFLEDAGQRGGRQSSHSIPGLPWKMSENVQFALRHSAVIAERTHRSSEIHSRHLFAALLSVIRAERSSQAQKRLSSLGTSASSLSGDFRSFILANVADDDQAAWDAILGPASRPNADEPNTDVPRSGIPLGVARSELGLDDPAVELLVNAGAVARAIDRQLDSFAVLALLMGWAERADDHSAGALTHALASQKNESGQGASTSALLRLRQDFMPYEAAAIQSVTLAPEMQEILTSTHGYVVRMKVDGYLRYRLLLAVILSKRRPDQEEFAAPRRLQELGYDVPLVRAYFRRWLAEHRSDDPDAIYDELLGIVTDPDRGAHDEAPEPEKDKPQPPAFHETISVYAPDHTAYGRRDAKRKLDDELGVGVYASHLAQLIAAKDTWMPLSVGLFGSWGAGKSYFIDLIDEKLRSLMDRAETVFHKNIVQIRFNAWHYLDTNLWANLACEIFDQLFLKLEERKTDAEQVELLKAKLKERSALAAEAKQALRTAEIARVEAETKLANAIRERAKKEQTVRTLLDDIQSLVLKDSGVKKQLKSAADGLGIPALQTSFAELEARVIEVHSLAGRMKALALAVLVGPSFWSRLIMLGVAAAMPFVVGALAVFGPALVQDILQRTGRTVAQLTVVVATLSAWLAAQAKTANSMLNNLEAAYEKVQQARFARQATDPATATAQSELAVTQQAVEQARHTLQQTEEQMKAISAEISELAPGRQLIRFLKSRASAEDYRRHLGLVSLVRKDFEQLSHLLLSAAETKKQAADTKDAAGETKERPADTKEQAGETKQQASETKKPVLPAIDRIVLYIDDLDRCKADRVIEILEAVHLLLAFPLFAVVVAVDSRWLRQSLLDQYPRLLGAHNDANVRQPPQGIGRPATPQDYLEKVFQVPFNLQSMEKVGYESLVNRLFPVAEINVSASSTLTAVGNASGVPSSPPVPQGTMAKATDPSDTPPPPPPPVTLQREEPKKESIEPQRLTLTRQEIEDIRRFQPLFQTPRAVKRFANTYCLIRVGIGESDWPNYLSFKGGPGLYRIPMLLLAVTSAFPALARAWLLWLRETSPTQWSITEKECEELAAKYADATDKADWALLAQSLKRLSISDWTKPSEETLTTWVPRVARYSF